MIEQAVLTVLRAHEPLMELMGGDPRRIDLVDVAQGTEPPYLTFNFTEAARMGRANLCDPTELGLLTQTMLLTPWAPTAPLVKAINDAARTALIGGPRMLSGAKIVNWHEYFVVPFVRVQSIQWSGYRQWAREPETNLLTRGQLLTVQHTE